MMPAFLATMLHAVTVKHACYVADQFREVNVPVAPAIKSTEVIETAAVFGPSKKMLGSILKRRDGKRFFADPATQQRRPRESYTLLHALDIRHPEDVYAGTLWPVTKPFPRSFVVITCK